jgi:large subunit ribosomal protein L25
MPSDTSSSLSISKRVPEGSRSARRLRREGLVPGVLYGGTGEPTHFAVDGRILRNTLARSGAILQVSVDGDADTPVLVKDVQRHPVRGEAVHVDFLRVNMNETIHTTVVVDLVHSESAPGIVQGGVLSQETREVNIEALPGDIPETLEHDVSAMEIGDTLTLSAIALPEGVVLLDDVEMVIASVMPPTLEPVDDEIETETALVGEDGEPIAEGEGGDADGDASGSSSDES